MSTSTKGIGFYGKDFFCIKEDEDLVAESIKRIIMTNLNERVGMPQFGGNLKPMLFEQLDEESISQIQNSLSDAIEVYEPRAIIRSFNITADQDNSHIVVSLSFNYVGKPTADPRFIEIEYTIE